MRYDIERSDPPRKQWVYLMAWLNDDGTVSYKNGDKHSWYRRKDTGKQINGMHIIYCVFRPTWSHGKRLSDAVCLKVAKSHFYETGVLVTIDFRNWTRGVVVTRPSNMRIITK